MKVEVSLLDGNSQEFVVDGKDSGADLLTKVAAFLSLTEKDYFGFLILDKRDRIWTWLHNERKVTKQLTPGDAKCLFQVRGVNNNNNNNKDSLAVINCSILCR